MAAQVSCCHGNTTHFLALTPGEKKSEIATVRAVMDKNSNE